jgi:hypothetical protein
MSWHFLQEGEEASWPHRCLDGAPSALLSLIPVPGEYCSTANGTELSQNSRCGTTCAHSTGQHGEDTLTPLQEGSHAKTSVCAAEGQDSTGSAPPFGLKWQESFAKFDPSSCCLRGDLIAS